MCRGQNFVLFLTSSEFKGGIIGAWRWGRIKLWGAANGQKIT
jgi:hypothetical protein